MAMKMADGTLPADINFDTNGDGKVTLDDANTMLNWSVTGPGSLISPNQQQVIDTFGYPDEFSISYLLDSATEYNAMVRTETWTYFEHQEQITFVAGDIYSVDNITSSIATSAPCSTLKPEDINYFTTYQQIADKIDGTVEQIDILPEGLTDNNTVTYLGKNVIFMTVDDNLVYLQTFCTEPEKTSAINLPEWFASFNLLNPDPVYARGFFNFIKKGLMNIIKLPDKIASKILPRQLAPIGSVILQLQLGRIPAIRLASRVNDAVSLNNSLRQSQNLYRQKASEIDDQISALQAERNRLNQGATALGMTGADWLNRTHSIDQLIPVMQNASAKLNQAANNLTIDSLVKIAGQTQFNQMFGNTAKVTIGELTKIPELTKANAIINFLNSGGGLNVGNVVNGIIDGDISRILGDKSSDKDLVTRIRESIKDQIKKDAVNVRDHWPNILKNTIAQVQNQGNQAIAGVFSLSFSFSITNAFAFTKSNSFTFSITFALSETFTYAVESFRVHWMYHHCGTYRYKFRYRRLSRK